VTRGQRKRKQQPKARELHVEYRLLHSLRGLDGNPKAHAEEAIAASVERFGFVEPVIEDGRTRRLVSGHGRVAALRRLWNGKGAKAPEGVQLDGKYWRVPVLVGWKSRTDAEAMAFALAVNRTVEAGGWNYVEVDAMLRDVAEKIGSTELIGFSQADAERAAAAAAEAVAILQREEADRGKLPTELRAGFEAADERQIVLVLSAADHEEALRLFQGARERTGTETNAGALRELLRRRGGTKR
jgi:ParB-like chromosome segregation protein Spo0J